MTDKKSDQDQEAEFKLFVQNMKEAIDEDLAHPENFEDDQEQLEAFREISKGLSNIDKLSRIDLFQLGMEVGGMIHMMELSNELFDAFQDADDEEFSDDESSADWDDEEEWEDDLSEVEVEDEHHQKDEPKKGKSGGCGNCGCH